jgi:DNA polymerase-1
MADNDKKLFLLDAFALIYRAFFALNRPNKDGTTTLVNPNFQNSQGLNTSTMLGFTNTLLQVLEKQKPTHIAVVFDTPKATTRHIAYPDYKAHRPPMPDDLRAAIPYVKQIIDAFNIPVLYADGYEADDVIGTLAVKAEAAGFMTYMMTPDKDFAQLVTDKIHMYRPGRSGNEVEIWDIAHVQKKFDVVRPMQVIDYLGMMGDKADNIPGIPGVGDKTARKFIMEFGGMEGLYDNLDKLKGKMKEKVEANKDLAFLSKSLATIILDAPVELDEKSLTINPPDRDKLRAVFTELEFKTLTRRVLGEDLGASAKPAAAAGSSDQIDMFAGDDVAVAAATQTDDRKTLESAEHSYHFTDTAEKRAALIKTLSSHKEFCFDTETSGVDAMIAEIVGLSFAVEAGEAWYVPTPPNRAEALAIVAEFKPLFENSEIGKIGQNLKYDITILRNYDCSVNGPLFDTMLAHYLLQPDMRHNMDLLAETYLNYSPVSITTLIGPKGKNQKTMLDIPQEEISDYACEDADITLQLKKHFEPMLTERGVRELFDSIETPLITVLAAMEGEGISLDTESLKTLSISLTEDLVQLEKNIYEAAGGEFKISSPKQVGEVLFETLKITEKPQRTATGQYKTSEDVLSKLLDKHPIVEHILNYRELMKLKNTYVDVLPTMTNPTTHRIHTSYNQVVAATGRLSSDNPNLQNIPIRTERGREVRKAFVSRDKDHVLMAADYSQIELRIIAQLSGDQGMLSAFNNGEDIHAATAAKVFDVPIEDVSREMRSNAKMVNFGIIYGISAFGLAQRANIKRKDAKQIIESYFLKYPGIKAYMDDSVEKARAQGYCETIKGRRRYLKDISSSNAIVRSASERLAINAPIQGSAADMIKVAMIDIHKAMQEKQLKSKMLLQVHDELVFDAHKDEVEELTALVKDLMQNAIKMDVPILVEAGTGENWLQAH